MAEDTDAVSNCARILLSTTKDWRPADGIVATLADARTLLADVIFGQSGRGFPAPASGDVGADQSLQVVWKACVGAARASKKDYDSSPSSLSHVVFWTAEPDNPAKLGNKQDLRLNWPFLPGSRIEKVSGPIVDGRSSDVKRLFFFSAIDPAALELDGDASPGLWPRSFVSQGPATSPRDAPSKFERPQEADQTRRVLATALFALWVFIGGYVAIWTWFSVKFAQMKAEDLAKEAGWLKALFWKSLSPGATDFSFLLPLLITMSSILLLVLAVGLALKGLWFGVLIDDRNRLSLSRTQQVAWSILLLGGLGALGWFNAIQGGIQPSEIFPTMDPALWAALGINLAVTPFLSAGILASKDSLVTSPGSVSQGATTTNSVVTAAALDRNENPHEAGWIDLVTGETAGMDNTIDVSRLQHLIISGVLLTTYFIALVKLVDKIRIADVAPGHPTFFTSMPPASITFLGLLAFSHASYLIFKARSKQADGTTVQAPPPG
jgi:hypothetical protein